MRRKIRWAVAAFLSFCSFMFVEPVFAQAPVTWNISIAANGNPAQSSVAGRRNEVVAHIGDTGMFPFLDVGYQIVVTWTGGGELWKSKYQITGKSGTVLTLSEIQAPFSLSNIINTGTGHTNYCQGSSSRVTINGFNSYWEIVTNGQVTSSGTEFIVTSINITQVPLCQYNL